MNQRGVDIARLLIVITATVNGLTEGLKEITSINRERLRPGIEIDQLAETIQRLKVELGGLEANLDAADHGKEPDPHIDWGNAPPW